MHANMLTLNGKRMSKSTGNTILPRELFAGDSLLLEKGFSPSVVRFFMMQAHYSSVLDFSNDALLAAEKGHDRLLSALEKLETLEPSKESIIALQPWIDKCYQAMSDNFNTPILIAHLFEAIKWISTAEGSIGLNADELDLFKSTLRAFTFELLGLQSKSVDSSDAHKDALDKAMSLVIELRAQARLNKDWATADLIRDQLQEAGIQLKDGADGTSYGL